MGKTLFHGTSLDRAKEILEDGFKFLVGGKKGVDLGYGVYFHDDKDKACQYGSHVVKIELPDDADIGDAVVMDGKDEDEISSLTMSYDHEVVRGMHQYLIPANDEGEDLLDEIEDGNIIDIEEC